MKRLSIIFAYLLLSIGAVVGSVSLMALTSSTAYAHNHDHDSDDDDSRGQSRNVNESRPLKADGEVRIDNVAGSIKLKAWDKNEVGITGTLGPLVQRLEINSSDAGLEIRVILPHNVESDDCDECADLEIQVPKGAHLEASTVSADLQASGMTGPVQLGTVSGSVTLTSTSNHIDLRTVSGDITVVGSAKGAQVMANSVSGTVRLSDVDGSVDAENVSGEIKLVSRHVNTVKLSSTSGDLTFEGDLLKGGNYDINNVSGDVDIMVGSSPDARFDVSSFSGDIDNNFGPKPTRVSKYSPGMELHFSSGNGGATLTARTLSGDIHLHS
ncbi:MAG TPA: DUF4097 family beta strand repeat-containing protein [Gammaproteobacteria bacterium]|jgi:DUF4097 and DUF4098 domain-containing protein YvlB|nr:DUF4097 family beta strand repeat-containing protein [Gammaproteobacteria bacterium]